MYYKCQAPKYATMIPREGVVSFFCRFRLIGIMNRKTWGHFCVAMKTIFSISGTMKIYSWEERPRQKIAIFEL